jgi:hypothetical protein
MKKLTHHNKIPNDTSYGSQSTIYKVVLRILSGFIKYRLQSGSLFVFTFSTFRLKGKEERTSRNRREIFMKNKIVTMFITTLLILTGCSQVQEQAEDVTKESKELAQETTEMAKEELTEIELETKRLVENMSQQINDAEQKVDQQIVAEGEVALVAVDSLVALNHDSYEDLYGFMDLQDLRGLDELTDSSSFLVVENGTEVEVLERDIAEVKVKIIDTELTGYIHPSLLSKSS